MTFLARIARFLFWLLVVSWSMWLLRRVFGSLVQSAGSESQQNEAGSAQAKTPGGSRRLVRDPVCGMHIDESLSIPLREGDELLHFCSIACRDAHITGTRTFAANG